MMFFLFSSSTPRDAATFRIVPAPIESPTRIILSHDFDACSISKDVLDDINADYNSFISQKESMQTLLKDFNKRMTIQIEELALPSLDRYLEPKYAYVKDRLFKCDLCDDFSGKSKQALSAHKRGCKKKHSHNTYQTNE